MNKETTIDSLIEKYEDFRLRAKESNNIDFYRGEKIMCEEILQDLNGLKEKFKKINKLVYKLSGIELSVNGAILADVKEYMELENILNKEAKE